MSLVGCSPWGGKESDMTEQLHFHFSLSCIGEGNGNPLQCSCLENPRDGEVWWAAVYGVTQSRTRLMRLSSSSSSSSLPKGLSILLIFLKEFLKKSFQPCGMWDLSSWSGINSTPSLAVEAWSLNLRVLRKVPWFSLLFSFQFYWCLFLSFLKYIYFLLK